MILHVAKIAKMFTPARINITVPRLKAHVLLLGLLALMLTGVAAPLLGQTISAQLSGSVNDVTGAVIPEAQVILTNQASRDKRVAKSNGAGFFSFSAVPAGTYSVEVQHAGFKSFIERNIELHPSDDRILRDIKMQIGTVEITVTVDSTSNGTPDRGEKSVLITADDIKRLPVEGRDVSELVKTLPGFAMTVQTSSSPENQGPNLQTVGGQTQNYTANGITPEGVSITTDGVNITDAGSGTGTDQIINMDNIQEVKIQTSNFGADSAKGPIVINAVGKSGGSDYHGSLYVYGRTAALDDQDWFSKYDGDAKPADREIYPGANIGGPVKIPGTSFNRNKKWTFFVGGEDYIQRDVYAYGSASSATIDALVPTCAMRGLVPKGSYNTPCSPLAAGKLPPYSADFSEGALTQYFGIDPLAPGANGTTNCNVAGQLALYVNICQIPGGQYPYLSGTSTTAAGTAGGGIINGQLATNQLDPGAYAMLNALMPLPNSAAFSRAGGATSANGAPQASIFNYHAVNLQDADSYQGRIRNDFDVSNNDKLYFVYSYQYSGSRNPQQVYYSPQTAFGEINTPGGVLADDHSHTASINYTKIFSASFTNELYAGVNYNRGTISAGNRQANLASTIGYPYQGIYTGNPQYPEYDDYGFNGLPVGLFPDFSTPVFQHKFVPNGGDNVTKLVKTHSLKFGFYIERDKINETDLNAASQGQIQNYYEGSNTGPGTVTEPNGQNLNTQGNYLASYLLGIDSAFSQQNFQTNSNLYYWTVDSYATDDWKATKKLTLTIGGRLGHVGPWQDGHGLGLAVWDPALYAAQTSVVCNSTLPTLGYTGVDACQTSVNVPGLATPGYKWHAVDKTVPNSGAGSTLAFFSPRFGMAYDMYGDSKTIFRGGIGAYRSHDAWNDIWQAAATAQGIVQSTIGGGGIGLRDVYGLTHGTGALTGLSTGSNGCGCDNTAFGLQQGDNKQPLTWTYSFTVDQQFKHNVQSEISYQGSQSENLLTQWESGAAGDLENINALPVGALFKPDPHTGAVLAPTTISSADAIGDYRQYPYYSQVNVIRHALYSNYNGLQLSLRKTAGRFLFNGNYTWSKTLGVFGSYGTGNVIDSNNIRPNYGPLLGDRSQVVNSTFSYDTGAFRHGNRFLRGALSSYDLSGIVNLQSGANAQRILNSNFNLQGNIVPSSGPSNNFTDYPISNINLIGTPDVVLQPAVTCDPRENVNKSAHQIMNISCFSLPKYGVNGPAELPYIHTPGYFDFDARLSKGFKVGEKRDIQLQLSGFNVINRPNYSFSGKFPGEQTLYYNGTTAANASPTFPGQFGKAQFRFGRRVSEISVKYNF